MTEASESNPLPNSEALETRIDALTSMQREILQGFSRLRIGPTGLDELRLLARELREAFASYERRAAETLLQALGRAPEGVNFARDIQLAHNNVLHSLGQLARDVEPVERWREQCEVAERIAARQFEALQKTGFELARKQVA